jgi:hypothetical protein
MKKLLAALVFVSATLAPAQQPERVERELVRHTEDDIQKAATFTKLSGKERDRNDSAIRHLAEFDAKYSRGDLDKGKLDQVIDDIKNIIEHNPLRGEDRDKLLDDLQRLRDFRKHHA